MRRSVFLLALLVSPAVSAETVSYTYDAKGRLVKVVRSSGPSTNYTHDKADNRIKAVTTGSNNTPPI